MQALLHDSCYQAQSCSSLTPSAMGSSSRDLLCSYCGTSLAGYMECLWWIPDFSVGPTCLECFCHRTEEQMVQLRLARRAQPFRIVGRAPPGENCPAVTILRDPNISCCIAAFLVEV